MQARLNADDDGHVQSALLSLEQLDKHAGATFRLLEGLDCLLLVRHLSCAVI